MIEKNIVINLNITFPEYEDIKAAIKECKRKWDQDDFQYTSEVTYSHILVDFPGGFFRIYSSEDVNFKLAFDDMRGGYVHGYKSFNLNKKGYQELIDYATDEIQRAFKVW